MATTLNSNPLIIPSGDAGATDLLANLGTGGRVKICGIRWVGATTNAHEAIITDNNTTVLWHSKHSTAGLGIDAESNITFWVKNGLRVPTLGSGTLYIYLGDCSS